MKVQYGDSCLSHRRVYEWVASLRNGRKNISDKHRSDKPISVEIYLLLKVKLNRP
jgi:hypothetical protein